MVFSLLLEISGQFILYFLSDIQSYEHSPYILVTLLFQCLMFLITTLFTVRWIDNRYYFLVFPFISFLTLNLVFLFNLEFADNNVKFATSFPSFSYNCFRYNESIVTDIFKLCIKPLEGLFEGSHFCPANTVYFYILFAVIPFAYYTVLTFSCYIVRKRFRVCSKRNPI